jgi:PhzF family phenazine biosynthesis protein
MDLPLYVVDAFTDRLFRGNPAAVCPLAQWLPDATMQSLAAENNLAETAFLVPDGKGWGLRWFTPCVEIDLCGHATLASAFVLARRDPARSEFRFQTRSGELVVTRDADIYTLDFPARDVQALSPQPALEAALGARVLDQHVAANVWIAELESAAAVQGLRPDFRALAALDCSAVSVTARGHDCDFVSRFFAPKAGIDEDPVTGSAHCGLVPLWAAQLGKTQFDARQLSARGGELRCELRGSRVLMSGRAVLYSTATVHLP